MSSTRKLISGIVGLGLIGVYSWVMISGDGRPGNWAWAILFAGIGVLAATARSVATRKADLPSGE